MTFEEAKKILEKEFAVINLHKSTEPFEFDDSNWFGYEKPSVLEAFRVLSKEGYYITISGHDYDMRKKRLEKEYEENTKAPGSGEDQSKEGNPALKEAASQFNDALLDEQAKKIKRLGKEIAKLNSIIHDKNAVLSDVSEELRLSKIREKNLAELGLKYVGENEKLKKELADKVVDKIDAQALKSAESALAWKEKTITYKDMALAYYEKKIAEKDEVIAELGEELKSINMNRHNERICKKQLAEKDEVIANLCNELAATKKELEEKTNLVEIVRNASKDYCDYGVAANEFIKKLANLYVIAGSKGTISNEMFERCKNYQTYGFPANCNKETKKEIDDIARGKENKKPRIPTPEEPKHDKSFENFVNETIDDYNRIVTNFGCIGSKDGNGIIDQMVGADFAEEGGDQSATIVECGKDIVDLFKEIKRLWQE